MITATQLITNARNKIKMDLPSGTAQILLRPTARYDAGNVALRNDSVMSRLLRNLPISPHFGDHFLM